MKRAILLCGALMMLDCPYASRMQRLNPRMPQKRLWVEEKIVREAGPRLAALALAVAWKESRFNSHAISRTRDFGVFQIHAGTAIALHLWDPLDEDLNITAGVGLLNAGYRIYGTEAGARCFFEHPARCGGAIRGRP